jgi:hypothetical protein
MRSCGHILEANFFYFGGLKPGPLNKLSRPFFFPIGKFCYFSRATVSVLFEHSFKWVVDAGPGVTWEIRHNCSNHAIATSGNVVKKTSGRPFSISPFQIYHLECIPSTFHANILIFFLAKETFSEILIVLTDHIELPIKRSKPTFFLVTL